MLTKKSPTKSETIKSPYATPSKINQSVTATPKKTTSSADTKVASVKNLNQKSTPPTTSKQSKSQNKTRLTVKYDVGFSNNITIRGNGANLNWEHGTPLKNIRADEWIWETEASFANLEFKILINDKVYEIGNNHQIACNSSAQFIPKFPKN